ncbi:MAG: amino acid adenylation domain-containing protein [Candidatus Aminicenantes bacterium]|nr:amino acid adenylation domain-containing protein [Candidatus Aminicenantes bacterium]NIM79304.1 amino acid adenylation domain-containing protein [Candidatus Aminicenantes bacterium]NIN23051.1 amino acid adenylation domain-containing protein [Candidatus Aminicenantes bacterium]NIN46778.1 amino acid adenylation domain-containing protein [Candidatus Aminicenantes bacterium]NIN89700.1 amino acid adenylation domain-containing protein [Candidatus Aminicenantes bacterium]
MNYKQTLIEESLKKKGIHISRGEVLTRRNDPGPFKLSFAQRRIWFLQWFDPQGAAYNDPTALRIKGPLNIPVLERTLNEIVRRHQVLRMNFPARNGVPAQVLSKTERITIAVTTLQREPGKLVDHQIGEFVNRFSQQPFDLAKDLLVRAALLRIDVDDYAFVVNIHHIVMDGWSKGIMLRELMGLYQAFSQGKPLPFNELLLQYTDYVHWLHERMQGNVYEAQAAYWKKRLAGAPPVLQLPLDHPRPGVPTGKGSLEPFSFWGRQFSELNALARREGATLFMVLLTAYNTLLFRYSGQEDILIGTPIAGRSRVELENLIGLFVNTLVIRTDLSREPTFKTLLRRVRAAALEAYSHQDMPFEKLVEELNPRRNLSVTPLFQVMFQLQNAPMPPAKISGLTITPIQIDTGFSQVDLSLTLWEEEGTMKGTFEYNTDLFESHTIKRMIGHFQALLNGIIANVDQQISQLPMLTEKEMHQLLVEWNDTDTDYPKGSCIYELFQSCAEKYPGEDAVIFGHQRLIYSQLNQNANRLAHLLQRIGVGSETLVGICMENSLTLITGVIGILKAGGAYIPMDPAYPDGRLMAILKDAQPPVLITQTSHLNRFNGYNGKIICLDAERDVTAEESTGNCINDCKPENAACIIYTSGSTGEPKGILINNKNIVNLVYSFILSYEPGPGDHILPLTSIASASFVGEILPILSSGGAVVLADKVHFLDMKKLMVLLFDYHITILSTVPSMIARLNGNSIEWKPGKLRLLLSGGEALSVADIDHLQDSVTIVNGYGLTEATICSTYMIVNQGKPDFSRNPIISVGKPINNTQIYILDKQQNLVPIGVPGEIYISSDGLARGYLNNPELTDSKFQITGETEAGEVKLQNDTLNKKFCGGPGGGFSKEPPGRRRQKIYKTGDLGCWLPDGTIKFLGRLDTQVQVHGYRIELSEIETNLGLHPGIQDVVVIDRDVVPGDKRLVAYLVTKSENGKRRIKPTSNQLRDWLAMRIPEYMIPAVFEIVEAIPLTANGKVDIDALPAPTWNRPELDVDFKAPQTEIEKTIAAVWQEFLRLGKVGINDNFFDLGGHSLLLTQVHSRLSEMYKNRKDLTIVDMFRYPTIHSLAKYIGEDEKKQPADMYQKIQARANKQRRAFNAQRRRQIGG